MDPETTHTIKSTNQVQKNDMTVSNVISLDENLRKKVKFQKAIKKMLTISARYLKAVRTADQIYERSAKVQIDRRAIDRNESNTGCSSGVRR